MRIRYLINIQSLLVNIGLLFLYSLSMASATNPPMVSCEVDLEVPDDITICDPQDFDLEGTVNGNILSFFWTQNGEFLTDSDLNPTVYLEETTTFSLTVFEVNEDNLIINGDFESGDYIEYTDYFIGTTSCYGAGYLDCEGAYGIETNPNDGHTNFANCSDMSGGGSMMVVNGAPNYQQIWCQTIDVEPEGIYQFSAWATSVNPSSPAQLQFAIDGNLIGDLFSLSGSVCNWEEFFAEWQSEGSTSVEICITNQNTAAGGNDFAIDNIAFHEVCSSTDSFTVNVSNYDVLWNTPETLTCIEDITDILLEIEPLDIYEIEWESDSGGIIEEATDGTFITVDSEGSYYVTVTDVNNCSKEFEIEVDADQEQPDIYIDLNNQIDCINPIAFVEADSDQGNVSYEWYDEYGDLISNTDEMYTSFAGSYSVLIINDQTGCANQEQVQISVDTLIPDVDLTLSNHLDCHNDSAILSVNSDTLNISWTGPDGNSIPTNQDSITVIDAGMYYIIAEADNHCINEDSILLQETESNIQFDIDYDTLINCNQDFALIDLQIDTGLFSFNWDQNINDTNALQFVIDQAGTYSVSVFDSINCVVRDTINIADDFILPQANIVLDTIDCGEPVASVYIEDNVNGYEVDWFSESGTITSGDTLNTAIPGQYKYSIKSLNGCSIEDSIIIETSEDFPKLSVIGDTITCTKTEIQLTGESDQPSTNFRWLTPNNDSIDAVSIQTNEPGIYRLTGTNALGCISEIEYNLLIDTLAPNISLEELDVLTCIQSATVPEINIDSTVVQLEWSGMNFNEAGEDISIGEAGLYEVLATAKNGCTSAVEFEVEIDTIAPIIELDSPTLLDCNIIDITPQLNSQHDSIHWTGPQISQVDNDWVISLEGMYTLEVFSSNGCRSTESLIIESDYTTPVFEIIASTIDCNNPEAAVSIDITGNYHEVAFLNASGIVSNELEYNSPFDPGLVVEVTGTNGCTDIQPVPFTFDTIPVSYNLASDTLDCSDEPVFIILDSNEPVVQTTLNYNGNNVGDITSPVNQAGNYQVSALGANGCPSIKEINVAADTLPITFDLSGDSLNCRKDPVLIQIENASEPVLFTQLSDSNDNLLGDINTLISESGTYHVVLHGDNQCLAEKSIDIHEKQDLPHIEYLDLDFLVCEEAALIQSLDIQGGQLPYQIQVNNEITQSLNEIFVQGPGVQYIDIIDDNGCQLDTSFVISPYEHTILELPTEINIDEGKELELILNISKDLSDIQSISWSPAQGLSCADCLTPTMLASESINYQVEVIDINGCLSQAEIRINVEEQINIYVPNVIDISSSSSNRRFTVFSENGDISTIESMLIFDRWGNRVFENFDFQPNEDSEGWDGIYRGEPALQGVYVYVARLRLHNDEILVLSGDVTVLK